MSGPSLRTKPKFGRLHALLGISPQLARGLLEFLWDSVHDTGDPEIGDEVAVETAAGWTGEPGEFCEALLTCGSGKAGFIEEVPDKPGVYRLHDLLDHSPADLIRKWVRRQELRERGTTISEIRAAAARARWAKANANSDAKTCKPMQTADVCMPLQTCGPAGENCKPPAAPATPAVAAPSAAGNDPSQAASQPSPAIPVMPALKEVADYLQKYGYDGDPADFLAFYRDVLQNPKCPSHRSSWELNIMYWAGQRALKKMREALVGDPLPSYDDYFESNPRNRNKKGIR